MRVEVLGGVERRRRWSRDDKMRIIEETLAPGAVVTEIARRHGLSTSLVFTWRRRARLSRVAPTRQALPFLPTEVAQDDKRLPSGRDALVPNFRSGSLVRVIWTDEMA